MLSVTELNNIVNEGINNNFPKKIKLKAEVSNMKNSGGHIYLNLKDAKSLIKGIIWRSTVNKYNIEIKDGNKIDICGHLNYYEKGGNISFIIDSLDKKMDVGELQEEYNKLKKKYEKKGYFDDSIKKNPPKLIKKIAIITAEGGAALQDILYVFNRHSLNLDVSIINVSVQGINCSKQVAEAINNLNYDSFDMILVTRGGGDMEDLFGFSDPLVIESIYKCPTFIVSAIGHEVDFMLSDYVADHRAPTPSIAAEFIYLNNINFINNLEEIQNKILELIHKNLNHKKIKLIELENKLIDPFIELENMKEHIYNILIERLSNTKKTNDLFQRQLENTKPKKDKKVILKNKNKEINSLKKFRELISKNNNILDLNFYDGKIKIKFYKIINQ